MEMKIIAVIGIMHVGRSEIIAVLVLNVQEMHRAIKS
jgi:hypothetical protein